MTTHTPPSSYVLKGLIDISVPNSISWLPQTMGWKILFFLLAALTVFLIYRAVKHYHANRYRRQALQALDVINSERPYQAICELFHLIKSVAIYLDPKNASKSGDDLLLFLISTKTNNCIHFHSVLTKRAFNEIWQPEAECTLVPEQVLVLINQFKDWITHHSVVNNTQNNDGVKNHD